MRLPTLALFPPRWTLLSLILLAAAALLWLSAGPAGAQDGHQPDQQVVADVTGYARETQHGHAHVLRWMRVLHTFDALSDMTSAEAQGFADNGWARWDPVAAELEKLEQGQTPDSQVVSDVRDYSGETASGADHVLRWYRVLHTFGALTAMTAAEAQGHANTFSASRWDPVVDELTELEAAEAGASGASDGGASGDSDGGASGDSDGGASGDSDDGATGDQSSCAAPVLTAQVIETYTVSGSYTVAGDECDAGGVYYELRKSADTEWTSSNRVSAGSRSFIHGGLQAVSYDFRVRVIDNRGVGRPDSEIQDAWITESNTGTVTPVAGTAGVRVDSNLAGESFVSWSKIADTTNISGYTIRYREALTSDFSTIEVPAETCHTIGTPLDECEAGSSSAPEAYHLGKVLDAAKTYWVQVGTKTTSGGETVTRFSPPVRAPSEEPYMVWFIDGTPNASFAVGRVFMMADTNHGNSSAVCKISGGSINCPPRTLVSLEMNQGGVYRVWASATLGAGEIVTVANSLLSTGDMGDPVGDSNHPQHSFDAGHIRWAWASGGDGAIGIAWRYAEDGRPASGSFTGFEVTSYVVKYQRTGGAAVWVPVDMVTNDDDEVDHYALRIPGLSAGEYTVIAYPCANTTAATTVTKCTAGNDPANGTFLGARARLSKVTVGPEKAGLPGVPTGVSAGTPGAGKVKVTWTHPRTESGAPTVHYYRARLTPSSGGPVYRNMTTHLPPQIRSRAASQTLEGVAAGTYAVAIQSRNANGGSAWVQAAGNVTVAAVTE